ncbi:hypothetical protein DMUE_1112 [Dictyocoela muelleri]|nr:hypothetical protein DMUE_1112 [Dictyocoela muelleri]
MVFIVETRVKATRMFAKVIPGKNATTILPIRLEQAVKGSIVYTDEHGSCSRLTLNGFENMKICHKYNFVYKINNVNTHHVESINNLIYRRIKNMNGVLTNKRPQFLGEICFFL